MRVVFSVIVVLQLMASPAFALTFTPSTSSKRDCKSYGMNGEFEMIPYEDPKSAGAFRMTFINSGEEVTVRQSSSNRNIFTSVVKCTVGCAGGVEIELNLDNGTFVYDRDIWFPGSDRIVEYCSGTVTD